ncbi:MAG: hypothetical protein HY606_00805 [Planctomycetes bacterium]|nr:hypothetical protein [Planctomycetota bacterium]
MKYKQFYIITAIAAFIAINVYLSISIGFTLKRIIINKQKLEQARIDINSQLNMIKIWINTEKKLNNSSFERERYLVEDFSMTIDPNEKIIQLPKELHLIQKK